MKAITIVLIVVFFSSCDFSSNQKQILNNENYSDTSGYYAARNLKGLSSFIIEKTTYIEAINLIKEEIRKDYKRYKDSKYKESPKYFGYEEKFRDFKFDKKGNIASEFYREDFGLIFTEVKYDTLYSLLKNTSYDKEIFGCPNIREIKMSEYFIGNIEINSLLLKFYKDTLFEINCDQKDEIENGFKEKYGAGKFINNTLWKTKFGQTKTEPANDAKLLVLDEKHIWENEYIKAESESYCKYKYDGDKYKGADMNSYYSSFEIVSKNKDHEKEIKECSNTAYKAKERLKESKKQNDIDKL
ncbi:MAG TPA: hypothetical protein DCY97_02735 [Marinilabiliales bacterium]|jgi:hypothetical protein|nr:hypothetical protein [Marinilabiliales bacterium]